MSVRRGAISSAIAGDNIYVSNGYKDTDGNATFIEKYSIKDNRWSVINSTLVPKRFANSETYDNKIYIFNGWGNSHLEIVDLETHKKTRELLIVPTQEMQVLPSITEKYIRSEEVG